MNNSRPFRIGAFLLASLGLVACGPDDPTGEGDQGEACGPTRSCRIELSCENGICTGCGVAGASCDGGSDRSMGSIDGAADRSMSPDGREDARSDRGFTEDSPDGVEGREASEGSSDTGGPGEDGGDGAEPSRDVDNLVRLGVPDPLQVVVDDTFVYARTASAILRAPK